MASSYNTAVLVPAASHDLVDLKTVKDELQIVWTDTKQDGFLARAISQVSAQVGSYCNRVFPIETVVDSFGDLRGERYDSEGSGRLQLSRYPVLPPLATTAAAEVDSGAVLPLTSLVGIAVGQPLIHLSIPPGTTVLAVAGATLTMSAPVSAPVLAGDTIGVGLGLQISDAYFSPESRQVVPPGDYQINERIGQIMWRRRTGLSSTEWLPACWGYAVAGMVSQVTYQAGYAVIPADVQDVALRSVVGRFKARGRDPMLRSQDQVGSGNQTYWVGSTPGVRGGFTADMADILDAYGER